MADGSTEERVAKIISEKSSSKFKSIEVFKEVEPLIDLGDLLLHDQQPINTQSFKHYPEKFLSELARENTQLLFNKLWDLPIERVENVIVAKLPDPTSIHPREKPAPKAKALTKWEQYAKKKGIQKKKRTRMIWDEEANGWKPRYGFKRANDDTKQWCIEVPENKDPYEDQFEKVEKVKKEKVAKNELQRLRNIAKNQKDGKGIIMSTQFKPAEKKDKERMSKEMDIVKVSTASAGKFQQKLVKEKENKKTGIKRKFESVAGNISNEKQKSLNLWQKINKPDTLNVTKAVNKEVMREQMNTASKKKTSGKVKNKHFRHGKQPTLDRMKGKTLNSKGRSRK